MLMKYMILILIALSIFILSQKMAFAEISCKSCFVGSCRCDITDCESGIFDVFSSTSCTLMPDYEFTFSNGYVVWSPEVAKSYYVKALCSDGKTQSECTLITVKSEETITIPTTTTYRQQTTTTYVEEEEKEEKGTDYFLIILVVLLIIAILFALYYFFFMKKGKTYEELYKKWGRRK